MRLERHHPVDRRERHGEAVDREPRPGEHAEAARRGSILGGPATQHRGDGDPRSEVDGRPDEEEGRVQVRALVAEERVGCHHLRARPLVELPEPEGERQEGEGEEGEGARPRLEHAPDDEAPGTARQVVDQDDRHAAERDAEPEEVGDEVGAEERCRIRGGPGGAGSEARDADQEAVPAEARAHSPPSRSSMPRVSAGTSASAACWLR